MYNFLVHIAGENNSSLIRNKLDIAIIIFYAMLAAQGDFYSKPTDATLNFIDNFSNTLKSTVGSTYC